jgi:type II secretory pathway component PulF
MLAVGDASGMMPQALERLAALYERQARTRTRILIETLSPLVVLIIGCGVLVIMVSVFMGLTMISDVLATSV